MFLHTSVGKERTAGHWIEEMTHVQRHVLLQCMTNTDKVILDSHYLSVSSLSVERDTTSHKTN